MSRTARTAAPIPAPATQPATLPKLIPLTEWPEHHAWPPIGGLRWLVFHSATNGFARAFVRVGKRILVDEAEFFRCAERGRAAPAAKSYPRRVHAVAVLDTDDEAA
jgi:hypothetical protein